MGGRSYRSWRLRERGRSSWDWRRPWGPRRGRIERGGGEIRRDSGRQRILRGVRRGRRATKIIIIITIINFFM